ncbi:ABC transporter ATP-binding protein [Leptothermofonsia sp. ETS-13]|uniref:ABC transporter ATP-binding protein n=1 Tax=Leptothermofonsia sp. ETS-13 TaxID=3035696 RepID=UPI003BA35AE6
MIILEACHLQKSYTEKGGGVTAVKDVSLQIMAGEVLAFLGPNGAGKTTTIKMIAGLIQPDAGWVRIVDRDPHKNPETLRLLGAVLEGNRNVYWRLTPAENLEYFGILRGMNQRAARLRARELLERFNLMDKHRSLVQSLSRGMQQKLAIAVAMMHQPPLLLLDEPTLGLDVEATEDVKRLIREIAREGCAILLTTHQLAIAEELSDRVAIINNGAIIAEEPTTELIRRFSGSAYRIEAEAPINPERLHKIAALGADVQSDRTIHIGEPELFYQVLEILKPLPLLQIQKDQANLTDVFLKLVRGEGVDGAMGGGVME